MKEARESGGLTRDVSRALQSAAEGRSASELLPLVYDELRRTAQNQLAKGGSGQTLQATALVHEAWLRLVGRSDPGWRCRSEFFSAAARAMRNILVEQYRRKGSLKRSASRRNYTEEADFEILPARPTGDMLVLDDALTRLEEMDPLKAKIVMLRFFTGMTMEEIARALGLPLSRIEREWRFTRAWLTRECESVRTG